VTVAEEAVGFTNPCGLGVVRDEVEEEVTRFPMAGVLDEGLGL
jgi:hypothetical protein